MSEKKWKTAINNWRILKADTQFIFVTVLIEAIEISIPGNPKENEIPNITGEKI